MKIFQSHLLKSLFLTTLGLGGILTVIIWLTQSLRFWKVMAYQGVAAGELIFMLSCLLPNVILLMFPLGFLAALLWRFFRLVQDNERDILAGCGAWDFFFMRPALWLSLILSVILCGFSFYLSPKALHAMKKHEHDLRHSLTSASISPGLFLEMAGRMLYVHKQLGPSLFQGIMIQDDSHPDKREIVTGRYAQIVQEKRKLRLFIQKGTHQQIFKNSGQAPSILTFDRYVLELLPKESSHREIRLHEKTIHRLLREYPQMNLETQKFCQKEIQQRLFLSWLPLVYCLWTGFIMLRSSFRKRRRYQSVFVVLTGVFLLECGLLIRLDPKMPHVFIYLVDFLYVVPFLLWISMLWKERTSC